MDGSFYLQQHLFTSLRLLRRSIHNTVSLARMAKSFKECGVTVAVKSAPLTRGAVKTELILDDNIRALRSLRSPNIVEILDHGVCVLYASASAVIAMEYCANGTLAEYINHRRNNITVDDVIGLMFGAIVCVYRVHKQIVHGNISSSSFLVSADRVVKLSMLSIAGRGTHLVSHTYKPHKTSPFAYVPPEHLAECSSPCLLKRARRKTARADMYALGIVLYEILTGRRPYRGRQRHEIAVCVVHGYRESIDRTITATTYMVRKILSALVNSCRRRLPHMRYNAAEAAVYMINAMEVLSVSGASSPWTMRCEHAGVTFSDLVYMLECAARSEKWRARFSEKCRSAWYDPSRHYTLAQQHAAIPGTP